MEIFANKFKLQISTVEFEIKFVTMLNYVNIKNIYILYL